MTWLISVGSPASGCEPGKMLPPVCTITGTPRSAHRS